MSKLAQAQALAAIAAAQSPDMTEAVKGGGGGRLLPAGKSLARLVEYVEFGQQPQSYDGAKKDPALEFQLGFALYSPGYCNDDGTPYIIRPYRTAMSRNEKARAFKLFKSLNWKGTSTHFAQLVGEPFIVDIVNVPKSQKDKTIVSRVNLEGFLPPLDPLSKQPYPVPEARDEDIRLFLWEFPTLEGWNELRIEGTYDDGKSKNVLQEAMLSALDFAGSPLEQLLTGSGQSFSVPAAAPAQAAPQGVPVAPANAAPEIPPSAGPAFVAPATKPASPAVPAVPIMPSIPNFNAGDDIPY